MLVYSKYEFDFVCFMFLFMCHNCVFQFIASALLSGSTHVTHLLLLAVTETPFI